MNVRELPRIIDLSCVKAQSTLQERELMVRLAKEHNFVCCFSMPCFTEWLVNELKDCPQTVVGAPVGFPSGADLTSTKVQTALVQQQLGCQEFDMVINVGALKDKNYKMVQDDIMAVRETVAGKIMKVILEVPYLSEYEICKGAEIVAKCGATFVKTGTGWGPTPTTVEHIKLLKSVVGNSCKIKAAGGVRTLRQIEEMIDAGCERFGIGVNSTISIMKEAGIISE